MKLSICIVRFEKCANLVEEPDIWYILEEMRRIRSERSVVAFVQAGGLGSMLWMQKLRLRVFALLAALAILVFGVVGMLSFPVLPAVGVALTIAVTMVNTMTSRLDTLTCAGCGKSIEKLPAGTHGIACKECGTINHPFNTGETKFAVNVDYDYDDEINDVT